MSGQDQDYNAEGDGPPAFGVDNGGLDMPKRVSRPLRLSKPRNFEAEEPPAGDLNAATLSDAGPMAEPELDPEPEPEPVPETRRAERVRRPVVALMGEFSAGKSTLSNLLVGTEALPVNVTATQLPPVWISHGSESPYRVDLAEDEYDIDTENLESVSVEDTHHIRIFHDTKLLEICDLIDMPGISDPNMAATVWQRVIHHADIVIWCSHATQAWRQSEAAVWSTLPPQLHQKSILLLTRMDKILSERDRTRVIKRVESETKGLFRTVLPVSLIKAIEANQSSEAWAESGADELMTTLVGLIDEVASGEAATPAPRVRSKLVPAADVSSSIGEEVETPKPRMVMPTRVRPRPLQG